VGGEDGKIGIEWWTSVMICSGVIRILARAQKKTEEGKKIRTNKNPAD